jgi:hypothetical protein
MLLSALVAGPNLPVGFLAAVFLDLVRVAMAMVTGAVPQEFIARGAFTTILWQDAPPLKALAVLLSGPMILALWARKRKGLFRLALFSLVLGLWYYFGGGP